jgi:adenylate cyclase
MDQIADSMKTARSRALSFLFAVCFFFPASQLRAEQFNQTQNADTIRFNRSLERSEQYRGIHRYDSAIFYAAKAVTLGHDLHDTLKVSLALTILGNLYKLKGDEIRSREITSDMEKLLGSVTDRALAANIYLMLGNQKIANYNYSEGLIDFRQAETLADNNGLLKEKALALRGKGIIYETTAEYLNALTNYQESLRISQKLNDTAGIIKDYFNIGNIYKSCGIYDQAIIKYTDGGTMAQAIHDNESLGHSFRLIGEIFMQQHDYDKAITNLLKSEKILLDSGNRRLAAYSALALGETYLYQNNIDKASEMTNQSIVLSRKANNNEALGDAFLMKGHIALKKNDPANAIVCYNQAMALYLRAGDKWGIADSHAALGNIFLAQGKNESALNNFFAANDLWNAMGQNDKKLETTQMIVTTLRKKNDLQKALDFQDKAFALADSIHMFERSRAIDQMRMRFYHENELSLLTAHNDLQKHEMREQKLLMTASFIIAGLLFLLMGGLINRFIYIHKTKNQLAEKNRLILEEKKRSEELLLNILPAETAHELMDFGQAIAKRHGNVTVLFTDFKEFSIKCEQMDPENLIGELDYCYKSFDDIISRHNLEKIKTIGDSYMAAGGLLSPNLDHPSDAIEAAIEILQCMQDYKKRRQEAQKPFFEIRIGIHSGPVVSGVVGTKKFAYDIWGDTVNIANRIQSASEAGKINVSGITFNLVKDRYAFEYRGKINVKYKGEIDMYYLRTTLV